MFHWVGQTDRRFVRISLRFSNRPSQAGYWKFNTSVQEIWEFLFWLDNLIQRVPMGAATRNKWCVFGTSPSNMTAQPREDQEGEIFGQNVFSRRWR